MSITDILTLDRFTFWASIWLLPFGGQFFVSLFKGRLSSWLVANFNVVIWRATQLFFVGGFLFMSAFSANLTQFRRFQPAFVDPTPIVDFLEKDEHWRWRYLTLGMGDQMAWPYRLYGRFFLWLVWRFGRALSLVPLYKAIKKTRSLFGRLMKAGPK